MVSHIEKLKEILSKQNDVEQFFKTVDETLQNIFSTGNEFTLMDYHNSMSLIGGDNFAESLFMIVASYDEKDTVSILNKLDEPCLIMRTKQLMAKYGLLLNEYNAKRYRPFGIKKSDCAVVNTKENKLIELNLTNIQGEKIVLRDLSVNFIRLCIDITNTLKESGKHDANLNLDLLQVLSNNVNELIKQTESREDKENAN